MWPNALVWLVIGLCVLICKSAINNSDSDCVCYVYGPSRMTELTLYYYPRTIEEAIEVCNDNEASLFTDDRQTNFEEWSADLQKFWEPVLMSSIKIVSGAVSVKRTDDIEGEEEGEFIAKTCPSFESNKNPTAKLYNVDMFVVAHYNGTERGIEGFRDMAQTLSFVCAREKGTCIFEKKVNKDIDDTKFAVIEDHVMFQDRTSCLRFCLFHESPECWITVYRYIRDTHLCTFLTSPLKTFDIEYHDSPGITLYIKQCYEPNINFEKAPIIKTEPVPNPPGFPLEKYCPLYPTDECPLESEDDTVLTTTVLTTTQDYLRENSSFPIPESVTDIQPTSTVQVITSVPDEDSSSFVSGYSEYTTVLRGEVVTTEPTVDLSPSSSLEPPVDTGLLESTPAESTPQVITTRAVMTPPDLTLTGEISHIHVETTPIESTPAMNFTEINMLTKTSLSNVSNTAIIDSTSCDCTCIIHVTTTSDRQEFMSSIIHNLEIDKKNVSRNRHRYRSMNMDRRWQTLSMGYLGVVLLVLIFGGIVLMDIGTLVRDFQMMVYNIRQRFVGDEPPADMRQLYAAPTHPQHGPAGVNRHDLERYSALAAQVWPKQVGVVGELQRYVPRLRARDNRDQYNPYIGTVRSQIYHSS